MVLDCSDAEFTFLTIVSLIFGTAVPYGHTGDTMNCASYVGKNLNADALFEIVTRLTTRCPAFSQIMEILKKEEQHSFSEGMPYPQPYIYCLFYHYFGCQRLSNTCWQFPSADAVGPRDILAYVHVGYCFPILTDDDQATTAKMVAPYQNKGKWQQPDHVVIIKEKLPASENPLCFLCEGYSRAGPQTCVVSLSKFNGPYCSLLVDGVTFDVRYALLRSVDGGCK